MRIKTLCKVSSARRIKKLKEDLVPESVSHDIMSRESLVACEFIYLTNEIIEDRMHPKDMKRCS